MVADCKLWHWIMPFPSIQWYREGDVGLAAMLPLAWNCSVYNIYVSLTLENSTM